MFRRTREPPTLCRISGSVFAAAVIWVTTASAFDAQQQLNSLNAQAMQAFQSGDLKDAEQLFGEVLQGAREVFGPRDPHTMTSINNLALVYEREGRYGSAEPLYQEALQVSREELGPRDPDTLTSLSNLAMLYQEEGRFGEAEVMLREAVDVSREVLGPRHPDTLARSGGLAVVYESQGRYSEAERLAREVLKASQEVLGPRHPYTLITLNTLASICQYQNRFGDAEPLYREALQGMLEVLGPRHPETLKALINLSSLYYRQGRFGDAEPLYEEALRASRELLGSRHPTTLTILNNLAGLYETEGRYREAEPLYREVLRVNGDVLGDSHPHTLTTQLGLTMVLVNQGRRDEATQILQQMEPHLLGWIGQEVFSTETGAVRRQLVSSQATFQDMVLTLATMKGNRDTSRLAATVLLHFKGLQGEEDAYLVRLIRRSQDPRVRLLADELGKLRTALAGAVQAAPQEFEKALKALESKQQELVAISPDYRDHLSVLTANVDAVRAALPAKSVFIEFRQFQQVDFHAGTLGEPRFAGLLLAGNDEPLVVDLGPVSAIQQLATVGDDRSAAKLYLQLTSPFEEKLAGATSVYLAPDGVLNLVSFARLKLADGRYWEERQEVHMLQSGRDLLRPTPETPALGLLALGDIDFGAVPSDASRQDSIFFDAVGSDRPAAVRSTAATFRSGFAQLPQSKFEVKDITDWYKLLRPEEPVETWSGADASKARLMALRAPPRVLHLATHGFYRPNESHEPMLLSGLALAGANLELGGASEDGILFSLEAEGLNLDGTELVVLSACDTAQGGLDYSEGVFGLARALRTAGARNVIVTLWTLKDGEARDFMGDFYKAWLTQAKSDPAKALRDTQLSWMKQENRRDPRAWAPYVLIE